MSVAGKEDPEKLALRARPKPVTRLNRRTLAVLLGGLALIVLLSTLWAFRDRSPEPASEATEQHNVERVSRAEGLAALPSDYRHILSPTPAPESSPLNAGASDEVNSRPDAEQQALRAEEQRRQAEAETAAKAQVFFQKNQPRATDAPAATTDATANVVAPRPATGIAVPAEDEQAAQNRQTHKRAFVDAEPDARIYASGTIQQPRSPAQLMAGTVIPAALLTGLNSDLPGQVIATVTEHVYDSLTGRLLLIPQGSRLLGQYDSQIAYGQRRVLLVWSRLIRPDGSSIVLDRLQAIDASGQAGLEDAVDNHWGRFIGGSVLSTLLALGGQLAAPEEDSDEGTVIVSTRDSVQETITGAGQQVTRRNLNLQSTLTVRAGFPLRVMVNRDLIFQPNRQ
ncbi:TrbI/VirB10 family protein [Pseudoxanthomonas sacheonensis]|uniref:Type IV secretion system protein VirB10 n=1 Tax=Pseudoxanthomonas sacheonensis TaxID=443615 RepID=A0ABU1RSK7_9GAMM|nr:TrbI/VirB10 family protein [Pseudoxanthomonas sacheonensis]MDR6841290.1 type IV secretion system protein VirB10 [Pseudoxanthomonas sacheonensis]